MAHDLDRVKAEHQKRLINQGLKTDDVVKSIIGDREPDSSDITFRIRVQID